MRLMRSFLLSAVLVATFTATDAAAAVHSGRWLESGGASPSDGRNPRFRLELKAREQVQIAVESASDALVYLASADGSKPLAGGSDRRLSVTLDPGKYPPTTSTTASTTTARRR
jgi:hypothetical protein